MSYFRDVDGREVDFVGLENRKTKQIIECKLEAQGVDPGLRSSPHPPFSRTWCDVPLALLVGLFALAAPAAASPREQARYLFSVRSIPVGLVDLDRDAAAGTYRYRSTHWIVREEDRRIVRREARFVVDGRGLDAKTGRAPSALWLWRRPVSGCAGVLEELTGRAGEACVTHAQEDRVEGTLLGQAFVASYHGDRLRRLELGVARFERSGRRASGSPPDLFAGGVPTQAGAGELALSPGIDPLPVSLATWNAGEARALWRRVHASFDGSEPGPADLAEDPTQGKRGGCLGHARRFVVWATAGRGGASRALLVHGLHVAPGAREAAGHAWVLVWTPEGPLELDPTLEVPVTRATHLVLGTDAEPPGTSGERYLSIWTGARPVERRPHVPLPFARVP